MATYVYEPRIPMFTFQCCDKAILLGLDTVTTWLGLAKYPVLVQGRTRLYNLKTFI